MTKELKNFSNFIYTKQWWKPKFLENKVLESFILSTDLGYDIWFDADILVESKTPNTMYLKPSHQLYSKIFESVEYLPPRTSKMNESIMPSWIKTLTEGKLSITEISPVEKSIEFLSEKISGKYKAVRENGTSDFWTLSKESQHKHEQCMECEKPTTHEVLWAEGMGHAWFCESHLKSWSEAHKGDINSVKEVKDGKASEKFADNPNPNIKK